MMRALPFLILLCSLLSSQAQANDALGNGAFSRIPMVHDGRVKPLDSFARILLNKLHGQDHIEDLSASQWLAESLFKPNAAIARPLVKRPSKHVLAILKLKDKKYYSYAELAEAFEPHRKNVLQLIQKNKDELSQPEQEFVELYLALNDFSQTTRALTLILPTEFRLSSEYLASLEINTTHPTYLDWFAVKERVMQTAKDAVKAHGNQIANFSESQQQAALLSFHLSSLEQTGELNFIFRIIPDFLKDPYEWYAPWTLMLEGHGSPQGSKLLGHWQQLAQAYLANDAQLWNSATAQITAATHSARNVADWQLALEVYYHQLQPVSWLIGLYGLCFLSLLLIHAGKLPATSVRLPLYIALILHSLMIAARMAILGRPPVSTLYESILFVSLISTLMGLLLDRKTGRWDGRIIASFVSCGLLSLSQLFAREGDTLNVVIAVLNTNFWLATHVVCITIGYGTALVAGCMAHLYMLKRFTIDERRLQTTALIALLFTAIGTILGGIWADQSWGRFWGWDPKENGALAIVLWLVWVLHGRLSGHFRHIRFACALAFTNIIVALSWFGVNLLNVGLHSYGFTDKAAYGLGLFCLAEIALIAGLTYLALRTEKATQHG